MKLSDYVISSIGKAGVKIVFEVCGGAITHLLDSLYKQNKVKTVSMHHEQAAAFAAEGYSRISESMGCAMATSGPGATNLITGIGSSYFDSIPCLFITGQVNTYEYKFNSKIRQIGFQETDIVKIVKPIVKDAILVKDSDKIKFILERSFHISKSGRPGPVLLDIPMNVQRQDVNTRNLKSFISPPQKVKKIKSDKIIKVVKLLNSSLRPIIFVGGGMRSSEAQKELLKLTGKVSIPVAASLLGLDVFPHENPLFVGMVGTYGNRYANLAIANSDLILALGVRFDTRQTGTRPESFAKNAKIIHVDIDPLELNNKVKAEITINSDVKEFLNELNHGIKRYDKSKIENWRKKIKEYKSRFPSWKQNVTLAIDPNYFMQKLSMFVPGNAVVCVDIGQHQMWAAQSFTIKKGQKFITQGGMGAMGSALPMGIGASFASPGCPIVVIAGDGGFQLNIQELETIYHHQLPIKIILLNNSCYGMVRQFQTQYFESIYQSTDIGYSSPNFVDIVKAYKISAEKISFTNELEKCIKRLFSDLKPMFLEVKIEKKFKVEPKLSVNKPIEDQDPPLQRKELYKLMIANKIESC